jgi:enoyl-CoA hydratase
MADPNAVDCEVTCHLYDAWDQLDREDDLRAAILTGRGNTFCAGMDLSVPRAVPRAS